MLHVLDLTYYEIGDALLRGHAHATAKQTTTALGALRQTHERDVRFRSPTVFKPYSDRQEIALLLRTVAGAFEDFRYIREIGAPDASDHAHLPGGGWQSSSGHRGVA